MISIYGILVRLARDWHTWELRRIARKLTGGRKMLVHSGPFKGMELPTEIDCAANVNKIVGSYEAELHPMMRNLLLKPPRTIVNIGAAEGYYAIGLARLLPDCRVYAFEMDHTQQQRCAMTAQLNGVRERVTILGECNAAALAGLDLEDAFLVVDCEGAEIDILDAAAVPALAQARLLVELHDCVRPGCGRVLWQRFHETHEMAYVSAVARNPSDYDCLRTLGRRQRLVAVEENRLGVQEWVLMTPKLH